MSKSKRLRRAGQYLEPTQQRFRERIDAYDASLIEQAQPWWSMEEILGVLGIAKSISYRRQRQATSSVVQQPRVPHARRRYSNRLSEDVYGEIAHLLWQGIAAGRSVHLAYYRHFDAHWRYLASLLSFYRIAKPALGSAGHTDASAVLAASSTAATTTQCHPTR